MSWELLIGLACGALLAAGVVWGLVHRPAQARLIAAWALREAQGCVRWLARHEGETIATISTYYSRLPPSFRAVVTEGELIALVRLIAATDAPAPVVPLPLPGEGTPL